jgi:hypothetical protein
MRPVAKYMAMSGHILYSRLCTNRPEWSEGTTPTADLATARGAPDATGYKVPDFRHGQQVAPFFFR